ncbi:MAG: hypothetical protein V1721_09040, partial [Pseudomonadota bacterium]
IFSETAAAAHEAFPEELKNLVVLTTSSELPAYIAPEIAAHLANNVADVRAVTKAVIDHVRRHNAAGYTLRIPLAGVDVKLIALGETTEDIYTPLYTKEMVLTANSDHEIIGHLAVKNGHSSLGPAHLSECAANAYAALRHIQRFGKETEFFERFNFADHVVLGFSPIHYTDPVVERVKQLAAETNISALSLRETAELAGKIALECRLSDETLKKIRTAFLPVAEAYNKTERIDDAVLRKCIEVMRQHTGDSDIYKAGKRFLSRPDIKEYLEDKARTDSSWKDALGFIKNHQTKPVVKRSTPAFPALS